MGEKLREKLTPEERRAQVVKAISDILFDWVLDSEAGSSEDIAKDILSLQDPDGEEMILVRDLNQTFEPVYLPYACTIDKLNIPGFVRCLKPEEAK